MTEPAARTYQLAHVPDGTSYTVRENLVDILERELLGPTGGPEELLPVSPRQVYLVGHIAPTKPGRARRAGCRPRPPTTPEPAAVPTGRTTTARTPYPGRA